MSIVTLTTDMGLQDFYVPALKARILKKFGEQVTIIDISHDVSPFNISQAAFILKHSFQDFPEGTIHIVGVDSEITSKNCGLIVKCKGQYFIGTDSGIFSIMLKNHDFKVYQIKDEYIMPSNFPTRDIFIEIASEIANGSPIESLGYEKHDFKVKQTYQPVVTEDVIRGSVLYIDHYGNIITNISRELFEETRRGRNFSINFRNYEITEISAQYSDVTTGEKMAIFNSTNCLEIAINRAVEGSGGGAFKLFGLKQNDIVSVEFSEPKTLF